MSNIFFRQFFWKLLKSYSAEISANWQHRKWFFPLVIEVVEAVFLFAESYLIKPIQRILKYPLLLVQLKVSGQEFLPKASSLLPFWLLIFFRIKGRQQKILSTVSDPLVSMRIRIRVLSRDPGSGWNEHFFILLRLNLCLFWLEREVKFIFVLNMYLNIKKFIEVGRKV
jgi:hypothetical protein